MPAAEPDQGPSRRPLSRLDAWWVSPRWVDEGFERQRAIDPLGHRVQTWLGALACLCLGGPTSAAELGAIPLMAAFVVRIHRHWRTWGQFLLQPLTLVVVGWIALGLASRTWTWGSGGDWGEEFGAARFLLLALALWTVSDRRTVLLGALAAGLALGQLSQVSHGLGHALGAEWLTWNRLPGRNSGWWDPVVGGSLLTAALGLHLPALLWGRGAWRLAGAAGAGAAALGVLATGTRGAWLAAAALAGAAVVAAALVGGDRRRVVGRALGLAAVCVAAGAIAWLTIGDELRARYEAGRDEVAGAIERREFDSDTGARVLMAWWAVEALRERPLRGVGLGGFEAWTRAHVEAQGIVPGARRFHGHAHNGILHAGATLGLPGLAIALAFALLAIRGAALREPGDGPPGYAEGPCLALLGLLLVSAFDAVQVNSHTAALLAVLTVFAVERRPAAPLDGSAARAGSTACGRGRP